MAYWLSKVGIDKSTIGFAIGLTTPYTLKFLWEPLVDRLPIPVLTRLFGQRRSWLFEIHELLVLAIWQLGASNPTHDHPAPFAPWASVVDFRSGRPAVGHAAYGAELLQDAHLP